MDLGAYSQVEQTDWRSLLLPCKKCGTDHGRIINYHLGSHRITCPSCGYCTKEKPTIKEACYAWNQRTQQNNKWISVDDYMPEEDEEVLLTDGNDYAVGFWREDAKAWDSFNFGWIEVNPNYDNDQRMGKITHWMRFKRFTPNQ